MNMITPTRAYAACQIISRSCFPRTTVAQLFSNTSFRPSSRTNIVSQCYSTTVQEHCEKANYWEEIRIPVPWGHIAEPQRLTLMSPRKAWGNKNGLPVLGLHGWSDSAASFDKLAPKLLDFAYFVAIDFPGHGFSSHLPPGASYNYVDFLMTLRRIISSLKWHKFSIIGHSMGAGMGTIYSSVYNTEVENLVLLDLHKNLPTQITSPYHKNLEATILHFLSYEEKLKKEPPSYTYEEAIDRWIQGSNDTLTSEAAQILLTRGARQVDMGKWQFTRDLRLQSMGVHRCTNEDLFDILSGIKCRLLLLKAKGRTHFEDESVFEKTVQLYKEKCEEFRFVEVKGNHYFHLNDSVETARHINDFFGKQ